MLHTAHLSMCFEWMSTLRLTLFYHSYQEKGEEEATKNVHPHEIQWESWYYQLSLSVHHSSKHPMVQVLLGPLFYGWSLTARESECDAQSAGEAASPGRKVQASPSPAHLPWEDWRSRAPWRFISNPRSLISSRWVVQRWWSIWLTALSSLIGWKPQHCEAPSCCFSMCHLLGALTIWFNNQELCFLLMFCSDSKFIFLELKPLSLPRYFHAPGTRGKGTPFTECESWPGNRCWTSGCLSQFASQLEGLIFPCNELVLFFRLEEFYKI